MIRLPTLQNLKNPGAEPGGTHVAISPTGEILEVGSLSAAESAARSASDTVMIDTHAGGESFRENPELPKTTQHALKMSGLRPISQEEVEAMSLREAYQRISPFFLKMRWLAASTTPGDRKRRWRVGTESETYQKPLELAKSLLGENYKLQKRIAGMDKVIVMGLSLLPHALVTEVVKMPEFVEYANDLPSSSPEGYTFCVGSNEMCRRACLAFSGHNWNIFRNAKKKLAATLALLHEPVAFVRMLLEACRGVEKSKAAYHFIRLNVLSDIPWEAVAPWLFDIDVRFYDYTKVSGRGPTHNYDLTFSFSGTNEKACKRELARGTRVAVVFIGMRRHGETWQAITSAVAKGIRKRKVKAGEEIADDIGALVEAVPLPKTFWGHPVVDGDLSDLRALDPGGVVVGLRFKTPYGQEIDPAASDFAFVTPAYIVDGAPHMEKPGRNPPEVEYLVAPLGERSTPFQVDEAVGPDDDHMWTQGEDVKVDGQGELGL